MNGPHLLVRVLTQACKGGGALQSLLSEKAVLRVQAIALRNDDKRSVNAAETVLNHDGSGSSALPFLITLFPAVWAKKRVRAVQDR